MSLIKNLFDGSKEQKKKEEQVRDIVHEKKNKFTADMLRIQEQSRKQSLKARQNTIRLSDVVESVTKNIAIATGGLRNE